MKSLAIARIAHQINVAYAVSLGDVIGLPNWEDTNEEMREAVVARIEAQIANPSVSAEEDHAAWLEHRIAEGWTYGETKDMEAKQHPLIVTYAQLPQEYRTKDLIFRAVVLALKDIPDVDEAVAAALASLPVPEAHTGDQASVPGLKPGHQVVRYIGRKPDWKDRLYGSGLTFDPGQRREVPQQLARAFLRHPDLFDRATNTTAPAQPQAPQDRQPDDTAEVLAQRERERQQEEQRQFELNAVHMQVDQMDKASLIEYGARYGVKIARNATKEKVEEGRADIKNKINQFGSL